jgi:RNA polymerase sigma factor (sigma-70 family)
MEPVRSSFEIRELLAHADWLRRLARHVVRGEGEADDLLQDTWVAALRAPPGRDREAQPWLAEVLRNFARRAWRSGRARQRREEQTEPFDPAAATTPDLLLERAQAQRLLAELVVSLDEPFRSTVLLRYFEGLSAAEIARSQGVPAGTVRWRLKEALDRLRLALDRRHANDRPAWMLLLSPLARTPPAAPGLPMLTQGGIIVALATQTKAAGAIAVLLLLLATGGLLWRARAPGPPPLAGTTAGARSARLPTRLPPIFVPSGEIVPGGSGKGSVEGQVVSAADGAGLPGAELVFAFGDTSLPARSDAQGRFHFAPADDGLYRLARVSAQGHTAFSAGWGEGAISFALRPGERIRGVRLALTPIRICRGTVVDEAGNPVEGARIISHGPGRTHAGTPGATSDAQGRFEFAPREMGWIDAQHGTRLARTHMGWSAFGACELRLQLDRSQPAGVVAIAGRVERTDGRPIAGATVEAWTNPLLQRNAFHAVGRTSSDADGRFQLAPLEAIPYGLSVGVGGRQVAAVEEVRGGTRDVIVRVPSPGRLRGQVQDQKTGRPVASFSIALFRGRSGGGSAGVFTRYDARGAFEIENLPAGPYRVIALAEARAPSEEQVVEVAPEPASAVELTFLLTEGARIHGTVTDRPSGKPLASARVALSGGPGAGQPTPLSSEVLSGGDGRFELRGVPPGHLSILVSADGHHGRVVGGLNVQAGDLGPLTVDLAPIRAGEEPRLEMVGIGAVLVAKDGVMILGQVSPGGGAAQAGLVTGDAILAMDGRSIAEIGGMPAAVQRIRGVEGTSMLLRVRRAADNKEADVVVTRRLIRP